MSAPINRERSGLAWARRVHGDNSEGCDWCAKHALMVFDAIRDEIPIGPRGLPIEITTDYVSIDEVSR